MWVSDVSATSGTITGLRVDTSYNVTVAIYTSKDVELGQTEPVIVRTGMSCQNNTDGITGIV